MELHQLELELLGDLELMEVMNLPRSVKLLIAGATLLGIGCVAIRVPEIATWDAADVLAVLADRGPDDRDRAPLDPLRHGTETVNFALTDGVWAGALLLVTPSVLTVSVLLGVGVGQALNRWKPYKIAYNVSQFLIGITLAEAAFAILGILGTGPTDPILWVAAFGAMYISFAVNATAIMLVVSMVEGERFLDVFRLPLSLNVVHWLGNMALGILAAVLWTLEPVALVLMIAPGGAHLRDLPPLGREHPRARPDARPLRSRPRSPGPLASDDDFGGFLSLSRSCSRPTAWSWWSWTGTGSRCTRPAGVRHLTVDEADTAPLEAFVAVRSGVSPQIAMVGDGQDVRGVLAVYRAQVLTATERLLLDGLADQIAVRLQDHRLFGTALERARLSEIVSHTSDGVFMVDTLGRITTWNPAMEALSGYSERGRRSAVRGPPRPRARRLLRRGRAPATASRGTRGSARVTAREAGPAAHQRDPRRGGRAARADRGRPRRRRGGPRRADQARLRVDGVPRAAHAAHPAEGLPR